MRKKTKSPTQNPRSTYIHYTFSTIFQAKGLDIAHQLRFKQNPRDGEMPNNGGGTWGEEDDDQVSNSSFENGW